MAFNEYPYTDFHEMNLDWVIKKIKELDKNITDFEAINKITLRGVWSITEQYPKWSLVNDGLNSYLSIKAVPVGIDINNTDYWMLAAVTSDRVLQLEREVLAIKNTLRSVKKDKILIVGDSYAEVSGTSYTTQLVNALGSSRVKVLSHGGYGFSMGTWKNLIEQNLASLGNLSEYGLVLFAGGCNDVNNTIQGLTNKIIDTVSYVKLHFVNATVALAAIGGSAPSSNNDSQYYLENIVRPAYQNTNGQWCYIANSECPMMVPAFFQSDGVHPNQSGSNAIFKLLVSYILGNSAEFIYPETTMTVEWNAPFTGNTSYILKGYRVNHNLYLLGGRPTISLNATTYMEDTWIEAGTLSSEILKPGREVNIPCVLTINSYIVCTGEILIQQNKYFIRFRKMYKTTSQQESISNITTIQIQPLKAVIGPDY